MKEYKEIEEKIKEIILLQFNQTYPANKLSIKTNLNKEFEMDELDLIEIIMDIEDKFDMKNLLPDEEIDECKIIKDFVDLTFFHLNKFKYKEKTIKEKFTRFEIMDI